MIKIRRWTALTWTALEAAPTLAHVPFAALREAESDQLADSAAEANDRAGCTGSGFVAGHEETGAADTYRIYDVPPGAAAPRQSATATTQPTTAGQPGPLQPR
ncbi:hypothetical protein AB0N93_36035 [Streptomyces sp. NPDC091267]|uniref:hypothetical protein n=1 Tax=Streptomyces sp. NPDC091267 TaxID=3155195 RepID=UPI00343E3FDD